MGLIQVKSWGMIRVKIAGWVEINGGGFVRKRVGMGGRWAVGETVEGSQG